MYDKNVRYPYIICLRNKGSSEDVVHRCYMVKINLLINKIFNEKQYTIQYRSYCNISNNIIGHVFNYTVKSLCLSIKTLINFINIL